MNKRCFEPSCMHDVKYICLCASPGIYSCKEHLEKHLKSSNIAHAFDIIAAQSCKETKERNIKLLETISPEHETQNEQETSFAHYTLDSQNLLCKRTQIDNKPNNPELEQEFRKTCMLYESNLSIHDSSFRQSYQDYISTYHQKTSLYSLFVNNDMETILAIYDTESESNILKIIETPIAIYHTSCCITQLPNGKLFCYRNFPPYGTALLINVNGEVEVLPSGTSCGWSSAIYYNENVYCFGGSDFADRTLSNASNRFDLIKNRWFKVPPIPNLSGSCSSVEFNGNILISRSMNRNLLSFSIDIESFSTIPYEFDENIRSILINVGRLYLIGTFIGSIYESEIGSYTDWKLIADSVIDYFPDQVYWTYNKGGIYIGCFKAEWNNIDDDPRNWMRYFKFSLDAKTLAELP